MTARIGLLWDGLTPNLGDEAIGLTLQRLATRAGLPPPERVDLAPGYSRHYDMLIIGGGELLQPSGHPFYDAFRVPGAHVLNTVGTGSSVDAAYLDEYRLVSVRSEADRENLREVQREVEVAPCLSVLFTEVAEGGDDGGESGSGLGFHISPAMVSPAVPDLLAGIAAETGKRIVLLSLTPYNQDSRIQEVVSRNLDEARLLEYEGPDRSFATIRRLDALVCTSLHATVMAYAAGIPFLSVEYAPKVGHFLRERNLAHRLVQDLQEVPSKLPLLERDSRDWETSLAADRKRARELVDQIMGQMDDVLRGATGRRFKRLARRILPGRPRFLRSLGGAARTDRHWVEPTHARAGHEYMMMVYREYGLRVADHLAVTPYVRHLESQFERLSEEYRRAIEYVRTLESDGESGHGPG